jgi:hypothetical protein
VQAPSPRDWLLPAWLALCAVTLVSLAIGGSGGAGSGTAVLALAFAKLAMVMFLFMDLRRAPRALQAVACLWLAAVLAGLLAVHAGLIG